MRAISPYNFAALVLLLLNQECIQQGTTSAFVSSSRSRPYDRPSVARSSVSSRGKLMASATIEDSNDHDLQPRNDGVKKDAATIAGPAIAVGNTERFGKQSPQYGWQKAPPKTSLNAYDKAHTASPLLLNIIELSHWMIFPACAAASTVLVQYHDAYLVQLFQGDATRLALWTMAPLVQGFASLPPTMAHIYEDWQVAPSVMISDDDALQAQAHCNEQLRRIGYSLLLPGQGFASLMFLHGYLGWSNPLGMASLATSAILLAYSSWGDKEDRVSNYLDPIMNKNKKSDEEQVRHVMPLTVANLIFFIYSQVMVALLCYFPLAFQTIGGNTQPFGPLVFLPPLWVAMAGILEGFVVETKFDQRLHLLAATGFASGAVVQCWCFVLLGQYLS